jgi:hypothetical protein
MMRHGPGEKASSLQIGFILNTGIMTTFIAIMLVVLGGGFGEDVSTDEELELVANDIEAKIIEADAIIQDDDTGKFSAYFSPPESGVDYTGRIYNGSGNNTRMNLTAPDGSKIGDGGPGERGINLDNITTEGTKVCVPEDDNPETFTQRTRRIFITTKKGNPECDLEIEVQDTNVQT